jgi:hypothetical protein
VLPKVNLLGKLIKTQPFFQTPRKTWLKNVKYQLFTKKTKYSKTYKKMQKSQHFATFPKNTNKYENIQ